METRIFLTGTFLTCTMVLGMSHNLAAQSSAEKQAPPVKREFKHIGGVQRLDPALDALVPPAAKVELLAEGFDWSEGPVWVPGKLAGDLDDKGGFLLFNDIPPNKCHRWSDADGLSTWLSPVGYTGTAPRSGETGANGMTLDSQGRLVLCQHGDRRIARLDAAWNAPTQKFVTIADRWEGKRFNSPNDLVYHSSGALYFTDPPYGMEGKFNDPKREIDFLGVYRVGTDGQVTLLSDKRTAPNGIAFSPDEKTLYVAQSDPKAPIWAAYDVQADGGVTNERIFFDAMELSKTQKGMPDGLKLDKTGNLFATGPGGVLVITPEGKHLGTIATGTLIANCAFGDDGKTLYMTADGYLARIRLSTTGVGF